DKSKRFEVSSKWSPPFGSRPRGQVLLHEHQEHASGVYPPTSTNAAHDEGATSSWAASRTSRPAAAQSAPFARPRSRSLPARAWASSTATSHRGPAKRRVPDDNSARSKATRSPPSESVALP